MQSIQIDPFSTLDLGSHTLTLTGTFDPASLPLPSNSVPLAFDTITGTGTIKLQPAATGQSIEIGTNCGFTAKVIPNLIMGPITADQTVTLGHNGCKAILQVNGNFISGSSASAKVSFVKGDTSSDITNAVTSYYCASNGGIANITCVAGGPPAAGYGSSPASLSISGTTGSNPTAPLTVSETGNATLNVTGITVTGADAAKFTPSPTTFSIADGGANQSVTVTCDDSSVGTYSATLNVAHDATGSPATYPLSCTISSAPVPGYGSTPASGNTLNISGTTGSNPTATLTVSETGNATLNVTGITVTGTDAAKFTPSPTTFSIADGGANQSVTVTCDDSSVGTFSATLNVAHNAGSPATYPVSCDITASGGGGGGGGGGAAPPPVGASVESGIGLALLLLGMVGIAAWKRKKLFS